MTSSIFNILEQNRVDAESRCEILSARVLTLHSNASKLTDDSNRYREFVGNLSSSVRSRRGDWKTHGKAAMAEWRQAEKSIRRESWNPTLAEMSGSLREADPPSNLESMPHLMVEKAESQALSIADLIRNLESRTESVSRSIRSIRGTSQDIVRKCEALSRD
ncbi:MAG: hypothetical protein CMJ23_04735 [Phycisphaerae bacterium]|nr:hypothetical protein [Phycisphaerae bacterium]